MKKSLEELLSEPLVYTLPPWTHDKETLTKVLKSHPEIKFVSVVGVDLGGNATDEKIPISILLDDVGSFLKYGVQTDGSSVVLHEIATLNNAKVDMIPDLEVSWFVDYNYELETEGGLPTGTLKIPAFLEHNDKYIDARAILKKTADHFAEEVKAVFAAHPHLLEEFDLSSADEIESVNLTTATELEFWVRTPEDLADEAKLSTSQTLKEQYWKRTKGTVRTALEETMSLLESYGFEPEMGHKEVGGVTAKIGNGGKLSHVMEQLEIDWKYSTALQSCDNELFIREIVEETFERFGLQVTFRAKPIEGVAGSGKHTHMGASMKLKNGKYVNLFTAKDASKDFVSSLGWASLMGLLHNYEVINPFVTSTNDAFNRLKPGFEAPVCIVGSVGHSAEVPSRNRTVLVGLVRDSSNRLATRYELRAPNPTSITYLYVSASYLGFLDGIKFAAANKLTAQQLEAEMSKTAGDEKLYLAKERAYRSEHDVFEDYTETERDGLFGRPPATVWENVQGFSKYPEKKAILLSGGGFTEALLSSYQTATLDQWVTELVGRIIPNNAEIVRSSVKLHGEEDVTDVDIANWEKVSSLKTCLLKDSSESTSLFTQLADALDAKDYALASSLQLQMAAKVSELKKLYATYKKNLF